jgi:hypothetical protein
MNEEFITFEKFNDQNSAIEFGELIAEQNIEFLLKDNSLSFDPTFANNGFGKEYCIKLKKSDFEKVNKILADKSESEIHDIDKDYYLFSFSDDELIEVVSKSDEWNKFDISLAKKILKGKGKEITPEEIEEIKEQRILELSKPEEGQKIYIVLGYITAFLGGLLGVFIGWHLLTYKKTLPNGSRNYAYSENDRKQGNRILIIGGIFLVFWIIIRVLT